MLFVLIYCILPLCGVCAMDYDIEHKKASEQSSLVVPSVMPVRALEERHALCVSHEQFFSIFHFTYESMCKRGAGQFVLEYSESVVPKFERKYDEWLAEHHEVKPVNKSLGV